MSGLALLCSALLCCAPLCSALLLFSCALLCFALLCFAFSMCTRRPGRTPEATRPRVPSGGIRAHRRMCAGARPGVPSTTRSGIPSSSICKHGGMCEGAQSRVPSGTRPGTLTRTRPEPGPKFEFEIRGRSSCWMLRLHSCATRRPGSGTCRAERWPGLPRRTGPPPACLSGRDG